MVAGSACAPGRGRCLPDGSQETGIAGFGTQVGEPLPTLAAGRRAGRSRYSRLSRPPSGLYPTDVRLRDGLPNADGRGTIRDFLCIEDSLPSRHNPGYGNRQPRSGHNGRMASGPDWSGRKRDGGGGPDIWAFLADRVGGGAGPPGSGSNRNGDWTLLAGMAVEVGSAQSQAGTTTTCYSHVVRGRLLTRNIRPRAS